jgi:hypothetical protein
MSSPPEASGYKYFKAGEQIVPVPRKPADAEKL